jgi:hypothetical protein
MLPRETEPMRNRFLPVLLLAAVVGALLWPAAPARCDSRANPRGGVLLVGDAESWLPCRILVTAGSATQVDRGLLPDGASTYDVVGSFRYWEEPSGHMLYVYDDVQNLVGRIVNPESVRIVDIGS